MIVEDENGMTMFGLSYWALVGNGRAHFSPFTNGKQSSGLVRLDRQ